MATTAILKPSAGFGENARVIYVYASGKLIAKIEEYKNVVDAAAAQDQTDYAVHVSSTIRGLTPYTVTTIS